MALRYSMRQEAIKAIALVEQIGGAMRNSKWGAEHEMRCCSARKSRYQ